MKLELMINQKYAQLNETDKEIVTFIVQHKSFVRASSLEQVAGESLFSKSSIFRACKKNRLNWLQSVAIFIAS